MTSPTGTRSDPVRAAQPAWRHRVAVDGRRGLTLIEILIVLGIIVTLMGLSVAAILRLGQDSPLKTVQYLVGDLVRQARHSALSTGLPVEIRIEKNPATNAWEISGTSNVIVFEELFERVYPTEPAATTLSRAPINQTSLAYTGISGYGAMLGIRVANDPDNPNEPLGPREFDRGRKLMRRNGDGFAISLWVRPPLAKRGAAPPHEDDGTDNPPRLGPPVCDPHQTDRIPLVYIGDSGDWHTAWLAFMLHLEKLQIQTDPAEVTLTHWVPYIGLDNHSHFVREGGDLHPSATPAKDIVSPIGGEEWVHLVLHYDGRRLRLFRDGWMVQDKDIGVLSPPPDGSRVYLGGKEGREPWYPQGSTVTKPIIDEVRIASIGRGEALPLPRRAIPASAYRLTITHDQSRVGVSGEDMTLPPDPDNPTILIFYQSQAPTPDPASDPRVELTVTGFGSVSARRVTPP